jgi:hypothetical protein
MRSFASLKMMIFARNAAIALATLHCGATLLSAKEQGSPKKQARPPKWSADVLDAFFEDARSKLVGTRPEYEAAPVAAPSGAADAPQAAAASAAGWSNLIDAETIETEIKRLAHSVAKDVSTPSVFKGGAYKDCRRHFSVLAMLFAVAGEYDGDVRWKDAAPAFRDVFSRAGHNCKVGTDQTFQEAAQRKQNLNELIAGNRPIPSDAERKADWAQIADRSPLMQRLGIAHEDGVTKWVANEREFEKRADDIHHEAQLMATIADVIAREGFDFWDDEQYAQFARDLRQAATDTAAAADSNNYGQAREAIGRATKACANCHEGYRG